MQQKHTTVSFAVLENLDGGDGEEAISASRCSSGKPSGIVYKTGQLIFRSQKYRFLLRHIVHYCYRRLPVQKIFSVAISRIVCV